MANITTYVSDSEIEDFFKGVTSDPTWVVANIPVLIRGVIGVSEGAAFNEIKERVDYVWCDPITDTKTYYLNGEGRPAVLVEAPITQLDEVVVINADGEETDLILTGTTKNVFWDPRTGNITLATNQPYREGYEIEVNDSWDYLGGHFPHGLQNVKVIGQFGAEVPAIVKMLEIMIMYKMLQFQNPSLYSQAGNMVEEKIGRYEYKLGVIGTGFSSRNYSLDAYIDRLFNNLPKINYNAFEAI